MSNIILDFIYKGNSTKIQCKRNEYMKDIFKRFLIRINKDIKDVYFMCDGSIIDEEIKLEEFKNKDKEIKILVNDIDDENNEEEIEQNNDIICPECGEICLIDIKYYKIILDKCINKHNGENIFFDEFDDLQKIKKLNILCSICNRNKNDIFKSRLFKCYNCKINLCPLCKSKHNKEHLLIDYELNNCLCNEHGERNISYCKECYMNLCSQCQSEHNKNHNYYSLDKLIANEENNINELRINIDKLKYEIKDIIDKFNKVIDNLEKYYNLNKDIITNYNNINNKNYQVLMNINNIKIYNEIVIKDINEIINENKIENKIKNIFNIYNKMTTTKEIKIIYKIGEEDKIRIFGDEFVKNNKDNFQMIINDNNYELNSFYNIKNEKENEILVVKLKQIKDVTNISSMFCGCSSLIKVPDISKWDTSNVTDMKGMFGECSNLSSLPDISKWNTNNVTNMSIMFCECTSLSSLPDISKWNTNNVIDMMGMFGECSKLSSLPDISKWNTNNVTDMTAIFQLCSSLSILPDISKWKTNNLTNMRYMFFECSSLSSLPDISKWNTNNVTNMSYAFYECSSS